MSVAAVASFFPLAIDRILRGYFDPSSTLLLLIGGPLLAILLGPLRVLVYAKLGNWLAHSLKYSGPFERHFYLYAAFFAPIDLFISPVFTLIAAAVSWQPIVRFFVLSAPLHLYQYILGSIGSRVLYKASILDSILITSPFLLGILTNLAFSLLILSVETL